VAVGLFWLYFASAKWHGVDWMKALIQSAGPANPIPGLHDLLIQLVAPNWFFFAILQTVGETVVGLLLVIGGGIRGQRSRLSVAVLPRSAGERAGHRIRRRLACALAFRLGAGISALTG